MNMQLRIVHTTEFEYDGKAVASYNQARLTPTTTTEQILVYSRLDVTPKPWTFEYRDYFGTLVTMFEVVDPHDAMTVTATSTVQTSRASLPSATTTWEQMGERQVADRWTEYLAPSDLVDPPEDFVQRAKQIAADHELPGDAALDLCAMVHDEVEFVVGATNARSDATYAWQQRAGVCQDMVHLVLGGLRAVGIPARYVSGYFHPDAEPVVGSTVSGQSHAWVEWWDDGWHGYDVANAAVPGDRYVTIAAGRDYDDVKPLSGIFSGAGTSQMKVDVEITRLA